MLGLSERQRGGSFDKKPNSDADVIEFMRQKIKKEAGLSTSDMSSLRLFDGDAVSSKNVTMFWAE